MCLPCCVTTFCSDVHSSDLLFDNVINLILNIFFIDSMTLGMILSPLYGQMRSMCHPILICVLLEWNVNISLCFVQNKILDSRGRNVKEQQVTIFKKKVEIGE